MLLPLIRITIRHDKHNFSCGSRYKYAGLAISNAYTVVGCLSRRGEGRLIIVHIKTIQKTRKKNPKTFYWGTRGLHSFYGRPLADLSHSYVFYIVFYECTYQYRIYSLTLVNQGPFYYHLQGWLSSSAPCFEYTCIELLTCRMRQVLLLSPEGFLPSFFTTQKSSLNSSHATVEKCVHTTLRSQWFNTIQMVCSVFGWYAAAVLASRGSTVL